MSRNKLGDLTDHLFAQLERLADETMTTEQVDTEAKRASAIVSVADKIVGNHRLQLDAARLYAEHGDKMLPMLPQIGRSQ